MQLSKVQPTQATDAFISWIAQHLEMAAKQSRSLQDKRAESYAVGYLGALYEQQQQWNDAQALTEQALILAETSNTPDIAYRWQWQLGRLLNVQGQRSLAIVAYTNAFKTLGKLRNDLLTSQLDVQFSFRESVEPVYRELVALLLQPTPGQARSNEGGQKSLRQAREVIEALQLAELDNFFREACLTVRPVQIDAIDPEAAVLYPIILPDRLEVILSLPNQPLRHYSTPVPQPVFENLVRTMRESLSRETWEQDRHAIAKQLYDLLVRPAEAEMRASRVTTLVFVLDGSLRNIPMAALYDDQQRQYLIEKYSLALTPGLQLLPSQVMNLHPLKVLLGGLSEQRPGFPSLPGVTSEVQKIKADTTAKVLLNEQFTQAALQQQIQTAAFPVIHLATHGQFSSDPEKTFLLTWDGLVNVNRLDNMLQNRSSQTPVELLVLSACQTADGDNRAALGLAGVAVRSGARSTIATLWSVDDASTALFMAKFYQVLSRSSVKRADAVRQAQLSLLHQPEFRHPFYWAPFVLVGNWL